MTLGKINVSKTSHDAFIDPLRIAAFASVLIAHIYSSKIETVIGLFPQLELVHSIIGPFWNSGAFGVSLFFIISGYVITKASSRETPRSFAIRRVFRIYPSLITALVLYWLVVPTLEVSATRILGSSSLFGDFWGSPNELGGVDWTLRLEIIFYLLVFIIMEIRNSRIIISKTKKISGIFSFKTEYLLVVATSSLLVLPIFPFTGGAFGYLNIFFPIFVGGISLALFQQKKISGKWSVALFVFPLLVANINMFRYRPDLLACGPFLEYAFAVFAIFFFFRTKMKIPNKVAWLASLTYVIYLFHAWLIPAIEALILKFENRFLSQFFDPNVGLFQSAINAVFSLLLFIIFAAAFSKYFEKPIIKWSRGFSGPLSKSS